MKKIVVIDIGSNTVKLVLYSLQGKKIKQIFKNSYYLRLLNYLKDGKITEEGINKLENLIKDFYNEVKQINPDCVISFATYIIRVAENKGEIIKRLKKYFDIQVLSGKEEAYYSAIGALLDIKEKQGLIFDIGGGSLEICEIESLKKSKSIIDTENCKSYPLGTLIFKDYMKDGKIEDEIAIRRKIRAFVNPYDFKLYETNIIVGVGGSIRALKKIAGKKRIKKKKLKEIVEKIKNMTASEIMEIYPISLERAKTVAVASIVALELMDIFKAKELVISKYGIREGIIYEKVVKNGEC
ncbi:Ppx/GppA phosphatase family protein [Hydrogenothermus marinus]|uniref:Exopolyphosphatase/guanosine-5'-triphosphate, 3'-diphosphate pyrophosphatase n=1 Tax=Hydrogenothermus marinus TaxID=133270 RepID=A0A3M0C2Q8_9AQUI|nr:phosphatase [Hydrogenothermus marinus]RMA97232.1 exopolyphosphatase/guanosine-5'-triphosphate,3'-diphosphate pyrophosphatase [Hydrogenothermus marinus]